MGHTRPGPECKGISISSAGTGATTRMRRRGATRCPKPHSCALHVELIPGNRQPTWPSRHQVFLAGPCNTQPRPVLKHRQRHQLESRLPSSGAADVRVCIAPRPGPSAAWSGPPALAAWWLPLPTESRRLQATAPKCRRARHARAARLPRHPPPRRRYAWQLTGH